MSEQVDNKVEVIKENKEQATLINKTKKKKKDFAVTQSSADF